MVGKTICMSLRRWEEPPLHLPHLSKPGGGE